MNQSTITISAQLSVRLSVYQTENRLSSWEEAIKHLLDAAESYSKPSDALGVPHPAINERTSMIKFPLIVYRDENDNEINEAEFKRLLIEYPKAYVRIHYQNGKIADRRWYARSIKETSNIRLNLASGYLRGWRKKEICKIEILVARPAQNVS